MQVLVNSETVKIQLDWSERLWAFHLSETIIIPLAQITAVTTDGPTSSWRVVRAPGTGIPGVLVAGTFYTDLGREFWYVNRTKQYLNLQLEDGYYKRIIISLENNEVLKQDIQTAIATLDHSK